ncbi:MAG: LysR family transcriptional regulator ArgP [Lautropia sp.]|nr:LysR family transcriptional regulator ArgP [Lautropia sp.]
MLDYTGLAAVAAIIEEGSFERAASRLHLTPSAVSHRVKSLEQRLGTPLIIRGTPCLPTEAGRHLRRHMERVRLLEAGLEADYPALFKTSHQAPPARARIVINADSLATWCMPALARFSEQTGCLLDIVLEDQHVSMDWLTRGEVDAAITATDTEATGCQVHPLGILRYHATASPAFMAKQFPGGIVDAERLATAPTLTFNRKDTLQQRWMQTQTGHQNLSPPTHWLPSSTAFVEAALLGMGWGMNPEHLVQDHLASGALVELRPNSPTDVPLYWQVNRSAASQLKPLTRCLQDAAAQSLR